MKRSHFSLRRAAGAPIVVRLAVESSARGIAVTGMQQGTRIRIQVNGEARSVASGTSVAHEPITAVVVATAHRIETRCSITPTSFDWA